VIHGRLMVIADAAVAVAVAVVVVVVVVVVVERAFDKKESKIDIDFLKMMSFEWKQR
jgi:hypothetical protein